MRIHIVGGGPDGLYYALHMKKRDPRHEVLVLERNPRDNTFGFGVVFSDRTLGYLRDNDEPTHDEIAGRFETWDNVDIVHRGEKVTIRGNRFSGIARIALLDVLQRRCLDLGVDLRFAAPVDDPAPLARGCDLLVGADGLASVVRETWRDAFGPSLDVRSNRYTWYGTEKLFHGLTLTFRRTEAGVFAAHSYKFGNPIKGGHPPRTPRAASTFIVECDAATFERAGFAAMPEEDARRALEAVFREDLEGRPLLSNRSRWIRFAVLKNERWTHGNVVLLGDALHTVHFSIGSGTRLAFEDAIALARSFDATAPGDGVPGALERFERERKPVVDEYQDAAFESLVWFETVGDRTDHDPIPFAYDCMMRSKRVDRESLRRRDPAFVAAYERVRSG